MGPAASPGITFAPIRVSRAGGRLAVVVAAAVLAAPSPATATEVTATGLRELAERSLTSRAALEELRRVDRVDGRPADLRAALGPARGDDLRSRLRTLAAPDASTRRPGGPAARELARQILAERRFKPASVPRPFAGLLRDLGEALAPLGRAVDDVLDRVDDLLPGGRGWLWSALALIVLAAAGLIASRTVSRRIRMAPEPSSRAKRGRRESARALERKAAEAERRGELELGLRLRFRAGLLRLDEAGLVSFQPSLRSAELSGRLRSRTFDDLSVRFDEVRYGGRPADEEDIRTAREGWPLVAEEGTGAREVVG